MAKKRKQNQWRDEFSDAKRRRSHTYNVGETSTANDGTPREEIAAAIREIVLEFKDAIQVKAESEKEIDSLKEKGKKYEEEIGMLKEEVRSLKEGQEDCKTLKKELKMLKEEQIKLKEGQEDLNKLKKVQQDLISQIQEMQRRCAEVDHYKASPSQRSQPSESSRLNLRIENKVYSPCYKKETITTEDGSGRIKVAMYDGNSPIPTEHPLASAEVHLVVIEGDFNEPKKDVWSKEEFEKSIIKRRKGIRRLVEKGTFELIGGRCDHEGARIMDNSQQKEVKLGVRVTVPTGVRVLEGVSNPFKVQESKTKRKVEESETKASKKKDKKPSPPVPTPNLEQPTRIHSTQHGQGPVSPDEQHSLLAPVIQDASQKDRGKHTEVPTDDTGEHNGWIYTPATMQQMVDGNGQGPVNPDEQQIQGLWQKADRGKHTEFPSDDTGGDNGLSFPSATVQQMVEGNGQAQNGNGQNYRYRILEQILEQSTSSNTLQHGQIHSSPPPNDLQAAVSQYFPAPGENQHTNFPIGSSELAHQNHSADELADFPEWKSLLEDQASVQENYWLFKCNRVLLQWDTPQLELKEQWNFLDQLMPLYSTKSRFYTESYPSTSLMDKAHKLLASMSSGDSFSKMITSGTSQAMQTPQRRGLLIRPIGPYDSEDEPPVKKQRYAKYQLRFVNRARDDYYTREQIKSEDGNVLKVALYDENNLVVTSGPLSSACVEVVLLHGDFNAEGQDYWTPEAFSSSHGVVTVDPRISAIYKEAAGLVGIDGPREELTSLLMDSQKLIKVVSIVGFGGLGKTTLAKQVYDKIGEQFNCKAFVSVSQRPDMRSLLLGGAAGASEARAPHARVLKSEPF